MTFRLQNSCKSVAQFPPGWVTACTSYEKMKQVTYPVASALQKPGVNTANLLRNYCRTERQRLVETLANMLRSYGSEVLQKVSPDRRSTCCARAVLVIALASALRKYGGRIAKLLQMRCRMTLQARQ
jgi:hypothetical protein